MLIIAESDAADPHQAEFFTAHLDPWLGRFFEDLSQAPSAGFYRSVGRLGVRFLEMEQHLLTTHAPINKE
jgi:TorA maturation chaperone TorD